jgi:hypothetical protein
METTEPDIHELKEARRKSAARVRSLLEELEAAEREFEALTQKVKIVSEALPLRNAPTPVATPR